ncbi:MAG: chorismate synthase [Planctomycetota bacterium]
MGNVFGRLFRIATWGESHGPGIGVVIDGCPPGVPLSEADIQPDLDRRRPGQSALVSARKERDACRILSGVFEGMTLGAPIALWVENTNAKPGDYLAMKNTYRPSHADFTCQAKYGFRDWRGGGRSSARETVARVAAGAVARKVLREKFGPVDIVAYVKQVHVLTGNVAPETVTREAVDATPVRCPDRAAARRMAALIARTRKAGDSVGGVIECAVRNLPVGLGMPVFDRLEADLAKAMLSIPATKGFEIGSGFAGAAMRGSEHNDEFYMDGGRVRTRTNRSGGVQGGISNGEMILFRTAFKPTATILRKQKTVTADGEDTVLDPRGRHDPCVLPRAVPIVEAMTALVLTDHALRHKAQNLW